MRADILQKIHNGHQGLTKCRNRANSAVWWPGLSTELKDTIMSCRTCQEQKRAQQKEPLISTPLPDRPWKRITLWNLWTQQAQLPSNIRLLFKNPWGTAPASVQVIQRLKATFARFGIPDEVVSDNGPQFSSTEFQELAKQLDFKNVTSSPQGNRHAERAVQAAKRILQQDDPLIALMCYRSTPCTTTGVSPAELWGGKLEQHSLPWRGTFDPNDLTERMLKDAGEKANQAFYYNCCHGDRLFPALCPDGIVFTKLDHEKKIIIGVIKHLKLKRDSDKRVNYLVFYLCWNVC